MTQQDAAQTHPKQLYKKYSHVWSNPWPGTVSPLYYAFQASRSKKYKYSKLFYSQKNTMREGINKGYGVKRAVPALLYSNNNTMGEHINKAYGVNDLTPLFCIAIITKRQVQRICCKGWRHWNADQTIVIWLWSKKNFEPLFNDEVARGVGILFNRGTVGFRLFSDIFTSRSVLRRL